MTQRVREYNPRPLSHASQQIEEGLERGKNVLLGIQVSFLHFLECAFNWIILSGVFNHLDISNISLKGTCKYDLLYMGQELR